MTYFERRPEVGGLWAFSENPEYTFVTKGTRSKLSKFLVSFNAKSTHVNKTDGM